ncbi:MAG: NUDIX hydrolase [Thermanaerothrix sp.]|nr:NUDIX hydrolase [Thermanaerothrix sp.]
MKIRVGGIITGSNGLMLMRYRHAGGDVFCIPGGGVDHGEWLDDALKRELSEELGITVLVGSVIGLAQGVPMGTKGPVLHVLFSCAITKGIPHLNSNETSADEICWISPGKLDDLVLYPDVKGIIKRSLGVGGMSDAAVPSSALEIPYVKLSARRWL